jgi:hypothetical protein
MNTPTRPVSCARRSGHQRKRLKRGWVQRRPLLKPFTNDQPVVKHLAVTLKWQIEPLLSPNCHSYRPKHGVHTAIAHVATLDGPLTAFDIANYFPSIEHQRLHRQLSRIDPGWWYRLWPWIPKHGLAMGVAFSPTLSNLYLHEIDQRFPNAVRYCDNIIVAGDPRPLMRQLGDMGLEAHEIEPSPTLWLGKLLGPRPQTAAS